MSIISLIGVTICFMMRFGFSLAITVMTPPKKSKVDPHACPEFGEYEPSSSTNYKEYTYDWSELVQGVILSSFYLGYCLTQIPGGAVADRFGPRLVLCVSVFVTSILTIFTPPAIYVGDWPLLIAVRIALGFVQGFFYASLHSVVSQWIPRKERGFWGSFIFMGSHLGNFLAMLATGQLLGHMGDDAWPFVFYIYGSMGLLWVLVFVITTYPSPMEHPSLSDKEKELLSEYHSESSKVKKVSATPYKAILTSMPVWAIIVGVIGHDWGFIVLAVDLPKFFKSVMRFNVKDNGLYSSLGYLSILLVVILSGYVVDLIEKKQIVKLTTNRIIFTTIASVGPSVGFLLSTYVGCNRGIATACFLMGMAFMGTFYPSLKVNPIDIAPNHAGFLGGLGNCPGNIVGLFAPTVVGIVAPQGFLAEWRLFFWITFVLMTVTNIFYIIFASAEIQPWNTEGAEQEPS